MKKLFLILSILSGVACADNPYLSKDSYIVNDTPWILRTSEWQLQPGQQSTFPIRSHMRDGMEFTDKFSEETGWSTIIAGCDIAEQGVIDGGLTYLQDDPYLTERSTCTYDPKTKQFKSIIVITDNKDWDFPGKVGVTTFPQIDATIENKTPYSIWTGGYSLPAHTTGKLPLLSHAGNLEVHLNDGSIVRWAVSCNNMDRGIYQTSNPNGIDPRFAANLAKCEQTGFFPHPDRFAETIEIVDLTGK